MGPPEVPPTENEEELLSVRPLSIRGLVVVGGVVDSRLNLISSSEVVVVVEGEIEIVVGWRIVASEQKC